MPTKITLDNKPAHREQDPMIIKKSRKKAASTRSKIKRTGVKKAYCHTCEDTLSIAHFTVKRTGNRRIKDKNKSSKSRKNTPSASYAPLRDCNECVRKRRIASGQCERDKARKRKTYKTDERTRKSLKEAAIRARAILSDSYIKKLLKSLGYTTEQIEENPDLIAKKRAEVKAIRESAANNTHMLRTKSGFYAKRERAELRPAYLRRLIKTSKGYNGGEITEEMILKKKNEILHERKTGDKVWVKRKTPQERKQKIKDTSDNRINSANDVYIRRLIKCCTWYKGEEITDKMITAKRYEVFSYRERKEKGIKSPSSSDQMSRAYIVKIISEIEGIPKEQVTDEQVDKKRAEITAKRNNRDQNKINKEDKAKLKVLKIEKKQAAAVLALASRLSEAAKKREERIRAREEKKQKEKEQLEQKEAKKRAKAIRKKMKRLEKKSSMTKSIPVYNFFTPFEIRH